MDATTRRVTLLSKRLYTVETEAGRTTTPAIDIVGRIIDGEKMTLYRLTRGAPFLDLDQTAHLRPYMRAIAFVQGVCQLRTHAEAVKVLEHIGFRPTAEIRKQLDAWR